MLVQLARSSEAAFSKVKFAVVVGGSIKKIKLQRDEVEENTYD